jgi:chorismate mutase / prephenate dehydrogenase
LEPKLEDLRARIGEIDRELVALAAERVKLARRAGEIKRTQQSPTIDYAHERVVMERSRATAAACGLDPSIAEDLLARLIRASVMAQEEDSIRVAATGAGKETVVVGGAGRMGRWIRRFLEAQGFRAGSLDPASPAEENEWARARLASADIVVCATPPRIVAETYDAWSAKPPAGVVVDIASIKTPIIEPIRRLQKAGGRVASIHPMFGPSIALLRDADVVICETGDAEATAIVETLFRPTTARLVRIPLEEHDRIMADLLALAHATAIAFALSLPAEAHPVHSTTFLALEGLASDVVRESSEVYYEIQADNPHSVSAVERLRVAVDRILATVRARGRDDFRSLLEEGRTRTREPRAS